MLLSSLVWAEEGVSHLNTTKVSSHSHKLPGLNANQWAEAKSTDLAKSLDAAPGFSIGGMGGETNRPIFRGLDRTHVQIAEDGNLALDLSATSPDHAVASTAAFTRSIKIHKGSYLLPYTSTLQGARIDLDRGFFLSNPYHDGEMLSTYSTLGGALSVPQNGITGDISSEVALGKFTPRLQLSGRSQEALWVPDSLVTNSSSNRSQVGASLQYDLREHRLGSSYEVLSRNYYLPGGVHGDGAFIEFKKYNTQMGYDWTHQNIHSHLTFLQSSIYQLETETGISGSDDLFGTEFARNVLHVRNQWEVHFHPFEINSGAQWMQVENDYAGVSTPRNVRNIYASWFHIEYEENDYKLRWGARGELFEDALTFEGGSINSRPKIIEPAQGQIWASRVEISHFVWNYLHYEVGVHKSSRIPLVEEYYSDGPHLAANSFDIGNAEISPEESYGLDFNLDGSNKIFEWRLRGYGNYYSNYLQTLPMGIQDFRTELPKYEVEGTEAYSVGYEIQFVYQMSSQWRYDFINEYIYGQNLTTKAPLVRMPPLTIQQSIEYSSDFGDYFLSSQYYFAQDRVAEFESSTPAGQSVDIGWSQAYAGTFGLIRAKLALNNVFHEKVNNALSRTKFILPQPGRHIETRVDWSF